MKDTGSQSSATTLQRVFEALSLLGVLATVIPLAIYWRQLPDQVPSHFGLDGMPDRFGGRGTFVVVAAVCVGMYLWTGVLTRVMARHRNTDRPVSLLTAQRGRTLTSMARAFVTLVLAWTLWGGIQVALGHQKGLGAWLVPAVVVFLIMLILMGIRMKRSETRDQ